jgi:hypothetical protein
MSATASSISAPYSPSRDVERVPNSAKTHPRNASYSSISALYNNSKGVQKMPNCEKGQPDAILRKRRQYSAYPHNLDYCHKNTNKRGSWSQLNMSDWRGNIPGKKKTLSTLV